MRGPLVLASPARLAGCCTIQRGGSLDIPCCRICPRPLPPSVSLVSLGVHVPNQARIYVQPACAREEKPYKSIVPPTRPRHISAGWGWSRAAPGLDETGQGGGVVSKTPILAATAGTPCVPQLGRPLDGNTCWGGSDMGWAGEMRERSPIMPVGVSPGRGWMPLTMGRPY